MRQLRTLRSQWQSSGRWPATWIIIGLNIFWFLIVESVSGRNVAGLARAGAMVNYFVSHGQLFRLFSAMFVHVTITHLLVNMISLWTLIVVESLMGTNVFLVLFLVSGVIGNLLSLAFGPVVSAGASGAIFGLFGAMLALAFMRILPKVVRNQLLFMLAINVVLDVTHVGIDWLAHLGGMVAGILLTILYVKGKRKATAWRASAIVLVVLTAISLVVALFTPLPLMA